jgi:hypothetical protein
MTGVVAVVAVGLAEEDSWAEESSQPASIGARAMTRAMSQLLADSTALGRHEVNFWDWDTVATMGSLGIVGDAKRPSDILPLFPEMTQKS